MLKIRQLTIVMLLLLWANVNAQWTEHFSYNNCEFVAYAANKAISGLDIGLFGYDFQNHTLEKIGKSNLLTTINITAISDDGGDNLIVGYSSGDIDIINMANYEKLNIPELRLSENTTEKGINSFFCSGNTLYFGTNDGIYEVNLTKQEIKSHYKLRSNPVIVNAITVSNDSILLATESGIMIAAKASNLLESPSEWQLISDEKNYCDIAAIGDKIIAAEGEKGSTNTIWCGTTWKMDTLMIAEKFRCMNVYKNSLLVASDGEIDIFDANLEKTNSITTYTYSDGSDEKMNVRMVKFINNDEYIIADNSKGLVVIDNNGKAQDYLPNGPSNNYCYEFLATNKAVYCTAGGINASFAGLSRSITLHSYVDGEWSSDTWSGGKRDAMFMCSDKNNPDSIYMSSWGCGIFKIEDNLIGTNYNASNSPLVDYSTSANTTLVGGMAYDNNSNLLLFNSYSETGLWIKTPENEWYPLNYEPIVNRHSSTKMIYTSNGNFWLITTRMGVDNPGLLIFNTRGTLDGSDDMFRYTTVCDDSRYYGSSQLIDEDGELISTSIWSLAEDKNGQIWVGSDNGVATFDNDALLFESPDQPIFSRIKVPRNDGTNNADYLLDGVRVTAIAVDGANRKWLGTKTDGVYLVSEDGKETLQTFNTSNSPLPSNDITSITTTPTSDEVFFATASGIVSYHSDAVEPVETIDKMTIYPNPVKSDYNGQIKIICFSDQTQVKISDIKGRLVYQATSNGGMVTWNGKGLDGRRVDSGVYLVMAISSDGKEKAKGQIVILK